MKESDSLISYNSKDSKFLKLDEIMTQGFLTKYPMLNLLCVYLIFIIDGIEMNYFNIFYIPFKEHFKLSDITMEFLSSVLFVGVFFGSLSSGFLTKRYNRINILKYGSLLLLISHLIMSIFFYLFILFIMRIFIGFALGLLIPIALNLFSEYLPRNIRGFLLLTCWTLFDFGIVIEGTIAILIMPNLNENKLKNVLITCSIFNIAVVILNFLFLKDSPRNLLLNNKKEEAFEILNNINKSPLKDEDRQKIESIYKKEYNNSNDISVFEIFNKENKFTTICAIVIFFIEATGYYGIYVISSLTQKKILGETKDNYNKILIQQIIMAILTLISSLIGGIMLEIKSIGRKGAILIFMVLNSLCLIPAIYIKNGFTFFFALNLIFYNIHGNIIINYVVEFYPTKLRDLSSGFLLSMFRIACFISQFLFIELFKIYYRIPYYVQTSFYIIGIIMTILLPYEIEGVPLDYLNMQLEEDESHKNKDYDTIK